MVLQWNQSELDKISIMNVPKKTSKFQDVSLLFIMLLEGSLTIELFLPRHFPTKTSTLPRHFLTSYIFILQTNPYQDFSLFLCETPVLTPERMQFVGICQYHYDQKKKDVDGLWGMPIDATTGKLNFFFLILSHLIKALCLKVVGSLLQK